MPEKRNSSFLHPIHSGPRAEPALPLTPAVSPSARARAPARFAVADYIEMFYNRQHLHSGLGYHTPEQALLDHHCCLRSW
jgi:transposase InsO family protein